MYGTIARLHVKPGEEQAVIALMDEWKRERKSKASGFNSGYLYRQDAEPETLTMVVAFDGQQHYRRNAESPEQDRWYRQVRSHLVDDPVWEDGEIVASL